MVSGSSSCMEKWWGGGQTEGHITLLSNAVCGSRLHNILLCFLPGFGTLWLIITAMWWPWTGRHHTLEVCTCPPSTSLSMRYPHMQWLWSWYTFQYLCAFVMLPQSVHPDVYIKPVFSFWQTEVWQPVSGSIRRWGAQGADGYALDHRFND